MKPLAAAALAAALVACAPQPAEIPAAASSGLIPGSPIPGTIGVVVKPGDAGVVVAGVRKGSAAERGGLRAGDVVLRLNGEAVSTPRHFYRLVTGVAPGSLARLDVLRDGAPTVLELPVRQLDLTPRAAVAASSPA